MIVYKNKEFRNLQEQVYKNMSDIANLKSSGIVLDEFGIKVVGQESSVANMPTVADYKENNPDWAYGDAYAIGTEPPYDLYILTREDANHVDDYWFNIGEFPAPGPQGPQGETGATGPQGQTGPSGADGLSAGFGLLTATAVTLEPNEQATVTVTEDGPNTAKNLSFTFGIPKGEQGESASVEWGDITGDIDDQTDLVTALQTKQNTLVSGTNIKTINNTSILGSGNITISGSKPTVDDFTAGPGIVIDEDLQNDTVSIEVDQESIPFKVDLSSVAFSGSYNDLSNKPSIPTNISDLVNDSGFIDGSEVVENQANTVVVVDATHNISGKSLSAYTATETTIDSYPVIKILKNSAILSQSDAITYMAAQTGSGFLPVYDYDNPTYTYFIFANGKIYKAQYDNTNGLVLWYLNQLAYKSDIPSLTGYATETWVTNQGYITGIDSTDITTALGYTPVDPDDLATVATTGSYNDLSGKPTIPTDTSDLTNGAGFITSSALTGYATETWVGQQGYLTSVSWDDVTSKPTFATVATSGSYNDLSNKPTIPAEYVVITKDLSDLEFTASDVSTIQANDGRCVIVLHLDSFGGSPADFVFNPCYSYEEDMYLRFSCAGVTIDEYDIPTIYNTLNYICYLEINYYDSPTITYSFTNQRMSQPSNYVTTNTSQTITGSKTFSNTLTTTSVKPSIGGTYSLGTDTDYYSQVWCDTVNCVSIKKGGTYGLSVPDTSSWTASKTIATTDDIPSSSSFVDLTSTQTITGSKTFSSPIIGSNIVIGNGFVRPSTSVNNYTTYKDGEIKIDRSGENTLTLTLPTATGTIALTSDIPSVPVQDVTVDGVSVVSSGTAAITMPTIPTSLPVETLTTEPSAAYAGPGMKIVYLSAEPTTKYAGYIYMIAES